MHQAPIGAFDELAEAYDRYRIGYAPELYDSLFSYGVGPGHLILDVGCGNALAAIELTSRGCRIVGTDISEGMLERARRRIPSGEFVLAPAESLPFAPATFDAAIVAQAFHWFDQRAAFDELLRTLRPGGVIAIWWKGLMRGDAVRMLRDDAALEIGGRPTRDLLASEFEIFEEAELDDKVLRVVPWRATMTVEEFLGYERSRALARAAFGERLEDYFAALSRRLGPPETELSLSYNQLLYLGRVPAAVPATLVRR